MKHLILTLSLKIPKYLIVHFYPYRTNQTLDTILIFSLTNLPLIERNMILLCSKAKDQYVYHCLSIHFQSLDL